MTVKRKLPTQFNNLLSDSGSSKDELVDLRRLGQTRLMSNKGSPAAPGSNAPPQMTLFSYVHLRAPLPADINPEIFGNGTKPEAYFLMRRSKDGYVSSTGMFKASFPWATKAEEDLERRYVKSHFEASPEETAGNLWVHPDDALTLSSDYHCRIWIEALVDDRSVNTDHRSKAVTPPPPYKATADDSHIPAPTRGRGRTRSASPAKKIAPLRKPRAAKTSSVKDSPSKTQTVDEETEVATTITTEETPLANGDTAVSATATTTVTKTEEVTNGISEEAVHPDDSVSHAALLDDSVKVEVETTVETKGDVTIESTHVKVELPHQSDLPLLPESAEDMIAKAKEMVAEAIKAEEGSELISSKKRKIEEVTTSVTTEEDVPNVESLEISSPPRSKRARVIEVIKEEKFQKRALLGLGATVAIGGFAFFSNML